MSNNTSRIFRSESTTVDPIIRKAKGDGAWQVVTRDGLSIGQIARSTKTARNGRKYREIAFNGQTVLAVRTAVFLAAFAQLSPRGDAIDQQDYFAYIEGAGLVKVA